MKIDYQNNTLDDLLCLKAQAKAWPIIKKAEEQGVFKLIHQNATKETILNALSARPTEAKLILDILVECGLVICGNDWICNAPLADTYLISDISDDEKESAYIESNFRKLCGGANVFCIKKMSDAKMHEDEDILAFVGAFENDYGISTAIARLEAYQDDHEFQVFNFDTIISFCKENHLVNTAPISVTNEISAVFAAKTEEDLEKLPITRTQRVISALKDLELKSITPITPKDVVISSWVKDHCRFGCPSYGSKHCPPFSPNYDETQTRINDYQSALLIEGVPPTRDFQLLMLQAEKIAFEEGYYRAFSYWAGPCCICTECSPPPHPKKCTATRPSMESAGIDVFATVRNAGHALKTRKTKEDYVKYFGLLLLD